MNSDGIEVSFKMLEDGFPVDEYCDNDKHELSLIHPDLILSNTTMNIDARLRDSMSSKEYVSLRFTPHDKYNYTLDSKWENFIAPVF